MNLTHLGLDATSSPMGNANLEALDGLAPERMKRAAGSGRSPLEPMLGVSFSGFRLLRAPSTKSTRSWGVAVRAWGE